MIWKYEYTDTYNGEANYSWVHRGSVEISDSASPVKAVKKILGLNNQSCKKVDYGDMIALYPAHTCTVVFISAI